MAVRIVKRAAAAHKCAAASFEASRSAAYHVQFAAAFDRQAAHVDDGWPQRVLWSTGMAIQFECPNCRNPIEVDDDLASQLATCPFCHSVVRVPEESQPVTQPPVARPAGTPAMAQGSRVRNVEAARVFGRYALICAAVMATLFLVLFVGYIATVSDILVKTSGPNASYEEQAKAIQERLEAQSPAMVTLFVVGAYGMELLAMIGCILGCISLRHAPIWQGVVATVLCGMIIFCTCSGSLVSLAL